MFSNKIKDITLKLPKITSSGIFKVCSKFCYIDFFSHHQQLKESLQIMDFTSYEYDTKHKKVYTGQENDSWQCVLYICLFLTKKLAVQG